MPELPEVEVVRRGLERWVVGRRIERAQVLDARSLRRHHDGPQDFEISLAGARVSAAVRRGKFLWLPLDLPSLPDVAEPVALVAHLGMSGQLLVENHEAPQEKHARVILDLETVEAIPDQLRFVDQRIFGGLWLSPMVATSDGGPGGIGCSEALVPTDAAHIARDALDPLVSGDAEAIRRTARRLRQQWIHRSAPIKSMILDQGQISGVGNIYADEALWRSRLHYLTPVSALPPRRIVDLLQSLKDVMTDALAAGGTSFDSLYVNVNGASGYFARSLNAYGREGEACNRCGTELVRERFTNRSSYLCPRCQRPRRTK